MRFPWLLLGFLAAIPVAFALAGLWWWVAFTLALIALLGAFEWLAVRKTGLTLSGQFLEWSRRHPVWAGLMTALLGGFVGYLVYHLATGH